ncbi:MAG: hypothetical protein ACE5E6_04605, partial [Phycisphaerae bacterium]
MRYANRVNSFAITAAAVAALALGSVGQAVFAQAASPAGDQGKAAPALGTAGGEQLNIAKKLARASASRPAAVVESPGGGDFAGGGDTCAAAMPIGDGSTTDATGTTGTDSGAPLGCGSAGSPDDWYAYTASCDGTATVDTGGTMDDTILSVWDAACGAEIVCDDDGLGFPPGESSASFAATAGTVYNIRVQGWGG